MITSKTYTYKENNIFAVCLGLPTVPAKSTDPNIFLNKNLQNITEVLLKTLMFL